MFWECQWCDACGRRIQLFGYIMGLTHYTQAHGTWLRSSKKPPGLSPVLELGLPFPQFGNTPHGFL